MYQIIIKSVINNHLNLNLNLDEEPGGDLEFILLDKHEIIFSDVV